LRQAYDYWQDQPGICPQPLFSPPPSPFARKKKVFKNSYGPLTRGPKTPLLVGVVSSYLPRLKKSLDS